MSIALKVNKTACECKLMEGALQSDYVSDTNGYGAYGEEEEMYEDADEQAREESYGEEEIAFMTNYLPGTGDNNAR